MDFERAHTFSPLECVCRSSAECMLAIMLGAVDKVWAALKCFWVLEDFY